MVSLSQSWWVRGSERDGRLGGVKGLLNQKGAQGMAICQALAGGPELWTGRAEDTRFRAQPRAPGGQGRQREWL